jgi:hypothetical protein
MVGLPGGSAAALGGLGAARGGVARVRGGSQVVRFPPGCLVGTGIKALVSESYT